MLKGIKEMINQKKCFQEAAEIIMEDVDGSNLDDLIILGEDKDYPEPDEDDDEKDEGKHKEPDGDEDGSGESDNDGDEPTHTEPDGDEDGSKPSDGDGDEPPTHPEPDGDENGEGEPDGDDDDILGSSINTSEPTEQPMPLPGEDLPTPVGIQTNEPITGNLDDILDVTIDLKSNTVKDILPIPPANAGEAIASDDILSQKIDSGFGEENGDDADIMGMSSGEESGDDIMDSEIDGLEENTLLNTGNETPLTEAISLGDDNSNNEGGDEPPTNDGSAGDPPAEDGGEENAVTSAVRDKVEEADISDDTGIDGESSDNKKDELLKKLGNITKNLEDAKKAIMNCL